MAENTHISKDIPHWQAKGVGASVLVIGSWLASLVFLVTRDIAWHEPTTYLWVMPAVALQTFLYTGLFITAHDAMHGIVAPRSKWLNDTFGTLAVTFYALFSFKKMLGRHHEHHDAPGHVGEDPDFHDGDHQGFGRWYLHFVFNYVTIWQIIGMAVAFNVMEHLLGISVFNLLVFWVAPALLSTLQLFYFGTYLPHRGDPGNEHHARSNDYAPWLSFLTCYHFGYHLEHHEHPWAPWWHLPAVRLARQSAGPTRSAG